MLLLLLETHFLTHLYKKNNIRKPVPLMFQNSRLYIYRFQTYSFRSGLWNMSFPSRILPYGFLILVLGFSAPPHHQKAINTHKPLASWNFFSSCSIQSIVSYFKKSIVGTKKTKSIWTTTRDFRSPPRQRFKSIQVIKR